MTISFNQGQYLPLAVESVLLQKDVDIEYIIVDAGSTDGSREYLRSLQDTRVRLVLEEDDGPADGLNKGFRLARGKVLGYLNADDMYVAGALAEAHDLLTSDPKLDVVYGDGWLIDGEGSVIRHFESTRWNLAAYSLGAVNVLQQSTFMKKTAFETTAGFNTANRTCWDGELVIDMAMAGVRIAHVRRDWGMFRLHEGGISGSRRLEEQYIIDRDRIVGKVTTKLAAGPRSGLLRYGARLWKGVANPGYGFRRITTSAWSGAAVIKSDSGFSVARVARSAVRRSPRQGKVNRRDRATH